MDVVARPWSWTSEASCDQSWPVGGREQVGLSGNQRKDGVAVWAPQNAKTTKPLINEGEREGHKVFVTREQ